jgi:hypothetical protein
MTGSCLDKGLDTPGLLEGYVSFLTISASLVEVADLAVV